MGLTVKGIYIQNSGHHYFKYYIGVSIRMDSCEFTCTVWSAVVLVPPKLNPSNTFEFMCII